MEAHPYYPHTVLMEVEGVKEAETLKVQVKTRTAHPATHGSGWVVHPKNTRFCVLNFLDIS